MPSQRAMWSVGDLVAFRSVVAGSFAALARPPLAEPDARAVHEHFTHTLRVLTVVPSADDATWVYGVTCMLCPRAMSHTYPELYLCDLPERPDLVRPTLPAPSRGASPLITRRTDLRNPDTDRVPTPRVGDCVQPQTDPIGHGRHRWRVMQVLLDATDTPRVTPCVVVECLTCFESGRVTPVERTWAIAGLRSIEREANPFEDDTFVTHGHVTTHPPQTDPDVADREARARWEAAVEAMGQVDAAVAAREQAPPPLPAAPMGPKLKPGEFLTLEQNHQCILRVTLLASTHGGPDSLILEEINVIPQSADAQVVHRTRLTPEMLARLVDLLGLTLPPAVKRRITLDEEPRP